jgi:3-oxoacyl-[acyl-carrier protein] reductase
MELSDRTALVTGGSRGIGLAIGGALAEAGARVAVIARGGERAEDAARSLPGGPHAGFGCDVAEPEEVFRTVSAVEETLGPVHVLVNNAGITRDNLFLRMKDEEWDEVIKVNLKGAFNMTKALVRGMMKRKDGVILNITSVVGLTGNPGQANYAASKAGLVGFTKSIARELASRNVRANAIAPGYIETDMTAALDEAQTRALMERIPLGRLGSPGDVAALARFLAGPWASYITGQVFTVDGGMVI